MAATTPTEGVGHLITDNISGLFNFAGKAWDQGSDMMQDPKYSDVTGWMGLGLALIGGVVGWNLLQNFNSHWEEKGFLGAVGDTVMGAVEIAGIAVAVLYAGSVAANLMQGMDFTDALQEPFHAIGEVLGLDASTAAGLATGLMGAGIGSKLGGFKGAMAGAGIGSVAAANLVDDTEITTAATPEIKLGL